MLPRNKMNKIKQNQATYTQKWPCWVVVYCKRGMWPLGIGLFMEFAYPGFLWVGSSSKSFQIHWCCNVGCRYQDLSKTLTVLQA